MTTGTQQVLLVTHTGHADIADQVASVAAAMTEAGFRVCVPEQEAEQLGIGDIAGVEGVSSEAEWDFICALGGDGTFLRAAELARPSGTPLVGINLGRVGFLAEAEVDDMDRVAARLVGGDYAVEERLTVDTTVRRDGRVIGESWALNEATVEKGRPDRMLEVLIEIDGRPLSRYGCDGVVCATPSGSTAHAMSAGGPVVWPGVRALQVVPIAAHALFSRPLVVDDNSTIDITIEPYAPAAMLTCDGRRSLKVPPGSVVTMRRGCAPVRVVRLTDRPFTDRLVAKLNLPVSGWRGHRIG